MLTQALREELEKARVPLSHLDWSRQAWTNAAKLVCHAHDNLASKGMTNEHLREESEMPEEHEDVARSALHTVALGCRSQVRRVPMAAEVYEKHLPGRKGLCE